MPRQEKAALNKTPQHQQHRATQQKFTGPVKTRHGRANPVKTLQYNPANEPTEAKAAVRDTNSTSEPAAIPHHITTNGNKRKLNRRRNNTTQEEMGKHHRTQDGIQKPNLKQNKQRIT